MPQDQIQEGGILSEHPIVPHGSEIEQYGSMPMYQCLTPRQAIHVRISRGIVSLTCESDDAAH